MFSAPPKGMKVKRTRRKLVDFDNAVAPVDDLPPVSSPGIYMSVVRTVSDPPIYPYFKSTFYLPCYISYALTDSSGKLYGRKKGIGLHCVKSLGIQDSRFLNCLVKNGISNWNDFIGCQEEITFDFSTYKKIKYIPYASKSSWNNELCIVDRKFIYEAKEDSDDAEN